MTTRPLLIWAGLVLAVTITSVMLWYLRLQPEPAAAPPHRSDYVLREFEMVMLDTEGTEAFTVRGPYLERSPDGKSITLNEPRFSFPDPKEGHWTAQSRRAWVSEKADEVRLLDGVAFLGPVSPQGIQTQFVTERLDILPKTNLARTDATVTVTQGGSILQGTHLRADMTAQRFQLANIQGRYAPPRP